MVGKAGQWWAQGQIAICVGQVGHLLGGVYCKVGGGDGEGRSARMRRK